MSIAVLVGNCMELLLLLSLQSFGELLDLVLRGTDLLGCIGFGLTWQFHVFGCGFRGLLVISLVVIPFKARVGVQSSIGGSVYIVKGVRKGQRRSKW
jgi:hypothetical protein